VPVAELNGANLWYEVAGDGPPVVFVHEAIGDSRLWDGQWGAFSARFRSLRFDFRGFGQSQLPGGSFSNSDDLRALLDHAAIDHAALVGGSMGANAAMEVAVLAPERVSALVVAPPGGVDGWSEHVQAVWKAEDAAFESGDLDEAVRLNLELWVAGPRRSLDAVDPGVVERVAGMLRDAFEVQFAAFKAGPEPHQEKRVERLADRLGEIRAPTLVVVGDEDVPEILEASDTIAAGVRGARKVVVRGAAHALSLERPEELNQVVIRFLDEALAG
jgi:pimeloyl-ACP methyl ester carboxylesterase